jgi:hypothetical protein
MNDENFICIRCIISLFDIHIEHEMISRMQVIDINDLTWLNFFMSLGRTLKKYLLSEFYVYTMLIFTSVTILCIVFSSLYC